MKFLNIEKHGIKNVVDEAQFKAIYQPAGWKIVGEEQTEQMQSTPYDEVEKKNLNKMKRQVAQKFDDGLIKKQD